MVLSFILAIFGISSYTSANTISIQDTVLNQVESTLPKGHNNEPQQFTILSNTTHAVVAKPIASSKQRFFIRHIEIDNLPAQLDFLRAFIKEKTNRAYGLAEINQLAYELNTKLATKGYVTSKVYVDPQSLSSGDLRLSLMLGTVGGIRFTGASGNYSNALGFHTGDILSIRSIEQTVDNLNSVLHQRAKVSLEPGSKLGETIVVFHMESGSRFEVQTGVDTFGNEGTGRLQANATISVAKPFKHSDMLYYSTTKAVPGDDTKGSRSTYLSYQIPVGYDTFTYSHAYSNYEQRISYAINPFISSGHFTMDTFSWTHVLHRNRLVKTEIINTIMHKIRHSFINGNEIDVQKRRTTTWEVDVHQTRYITNGMLDWKLAYIRGMHWWADPGPTDAIGDATTKYNLYVGTATYTKQFPLDAKYKWTYRLEIKGQYTPSHLYANEFFNLGGWYAVRGYSGDNNLSAEKGFYVRNTVELPTSPINTVYLGVDYGKVSGHYSSELLGQELAGGVIGVKGQYQNISYNLFGAYPFSKPEGFIVPNALLGLQLNITL